MEVRIFPEATKPVGNYLPRGVGINFCQVAQIALEGICFQRLMVGIPRGVFFELFVPRNGKNVRVRCYLLLEEVQNVV